MSYWFKKTLANKKTNLNFEQLKKINIQPMSLAAYQFGDVELPIFVLIFSTAPAC